MGGCGFSVDQFWKEPRELLVDRVEDARDAQQETVEEFQTTMEKFKSVTNFDGGDLEKQFNTLNSAFERSEKAAINISNRVDKVEQASEALLKEWREELQQYHDESLRQRSQRQYDETSVQSEKLIVAMRRAEVKTKPVLDVFRDQVLFMKHNLNMQAITSLDSQTAEIETNVAGLIQEMEISIAEANQFIEAMDFTE
ncbi:MAG TPA: DUF2959 domain-containing protein [Gammaproteobacteria bacterium]|nr:DUF2959 domain-containing protein [Gammaproteobacteria bacterium]